MTKTLIPLLFVFLLGGCGEKGSDAEPGERWYTQSQVDKGRVSYEQNCAKCHGGNAESTLKWNEALPDGSYPPPPLNGTAHTWHHPLRILRRTIYSGGVPIGGTMPSFKDTLDQEDTDAVIAYFQSKWNKEIYDAWLKRGGLQ